MSDKTIVFIDAENVSVSDYKNIYKKKIKKFSKEYGIKPSDIKFRAYAVENGPTSNSWKSDNVKMIKVLGNPAKNKADNQIAKELLDQANNGNTVCLLLTHDKGLKNKVKKSIDGVRFVDEIK